MDEPKTVSQISSMLLLKGKKALMSLYNYFQTQKAKTIFFLEKLAGYLWIRTNPLFFSPGQLDLILDKQSAPKTKMSTGSTYAKIENLNRASPERLEAVLKLNRINKFGYYNKETKEFEYTNNVKAEIDDLFLSYCSRVRQEKIILTRAPGGNPCFGSDIHINYKTKYTSQERQQANLNGFRAAFAKGSKSRYKGVFLTLTAPPALAKTLLQQNKDMLAAWGKMNKFLSKALPSRVDWLKVNEFQKNGRLHFHIIYFGVNWLLTKSLIQYAWQYYGGGEILDVHSINQEVGRGWHWARSCPYEAAGKQPFDYLSAYLEKSMSPAHGSMYWVTGCRNWTCSKSLMPEKIIEAKAPKTSKTRYFLKGVASAITGFRASHRIDSMRLFSGSLMGSKKSKTEQQGETKIKQPVQDLTFTRATDLSYQC